jgi:hypothetical protein
MGLWPHICFSGETSSTLAWLSCRGFWRPPGPPVVGITSNLSRGPPPPS